MNYKRVEEAVVAVMRDVHAVAKNEVNQAQKFKFRGVDAVVNALAPAMRTHGLFVIPNVKACEYSTRVSANGGELQICRMEVSFWLLSESAEGSIIGCVRSEAFDSGDKATAKAMSVALRTFLLQTFMLPTDDKDPDADTYEVKRNEPRNDKATQEAINAFAARIEAETTLTGLDTLYSEAVSAGMADVLRPVFSGRKVALQNAK